MHDNNPDKASTRTLQIDLQTRFGRIRGNLAVPLGGMRLSELAWNSMVIDERLVSMAVTAEANQGRAVACQKGCGACCRQAVPLSPAEAWMISDVVAAMPPDRKAETLARFAAAQERLREEGFGDRSTSGQATEDEILDLGLDYFRLGIPCPFLVQESCSIYPNRPSACREYLVTSPPAHCSLTGTKPVRAVPMAGSLTEALSLLSALILGTEQRVIPLTLALDWANENREAQAALHDSAFLMDALIQFLVRPAFPGSTTPSPESPSSPPPPAESVPLG